MGGTQGASASSAIQKRVKMRLGTVDTGYRQARNARPPRQLRSLALIAVFLLSACGGSETDPRIDEPSRPVAREGASQPHC